MTSMPWDVLSQAGIGVMGISLTAYFIRQIFTGKWVPASERDFWREAFFTEQKMRQDMEIVGRLQRKVLSSLPEPTRTPDD